MQFRDLQRQYRVLQPKIDAAVAEIMASGAFVMGKSVTDLEQKLADYVGVKHCVSCGNGTDALRLALMAWGIGKGDAVFVPDFTFFASAEAVALQGATPIFVDVCEDTFNIDIHDLTHRYDSVIRAGELKPRAVIGVDLFGLPADFNALRQFTEKHNLHLLEDGAQGFGGTIVDRKACSFGEIACTSFFPAKPLGCYGDGGAIFTDNDETDALLRSLRVHGKGSDKYDNVRIGINSRLDTIQAAILQVKLDAFAEELKTVNKVAERYSEMLKSRVEVPHIPIGYVSSWAQYTIKIANREKVQQAMHEAGIPTAIYYPRAMHQQSAFSSIGRYQMPYQVTERLTRSVLSLPMHPYITEEEIAFVAQTLLKVI